MTVPLLPIAANNMSPGTGYSRTLKSGRIRYADGYGQSMKRGIAPAPQVWTLTWNDLTVAEGEALDAFFTELNRLGTTFRWTPIGKSVEAQYEPDGEFSVTYDSRHDTASASLTVREVRGV
jgi:phage-related protein